jgi:hypothetical protein
MSSVKKCIMQVKDVDIIEWGWLGRSELWAGVRWKHVILAGNWFKVCRRRPTKPNYHSNVDAPIGSW